MMSNNTLEKAVNTEFDHDNHEMVTMVVADQFVGIHVKTVRDILGPQRITHVPLAPPEVAGVLNLRGRIVTAIDLCCRLGMGSTHSRTDSGMSIVVEHEGELYSLLIDQVGEVLHVSDSQFVQDTTSLSDSWREIAQGIFRLEERLLVLLDVSSILAFDR